MIVLHVNLHRQETVRGEFEKGARPHDMELE